MARRQIAARTLLGALPLFAGLDADTIARLAAATTRRSLERGERVFAKGDRASGMYVVVHGEIQLVARSATRGARLTGVVGAGRSFGEPVMFLGRPTVVEAVAATDALVLRLPREAVFAEIDRDPRFARRIIANLSRRIESLVNELDRQAAGGGSARLAEYLLRLGGDGPGPLSVRLPATKAAIASQLNLTPEHLSRLLRKLGAAGLLAVHGRNITIDDPARLAAGAGAVPPAGSATCPAPPRRP